MTEERSEDRMLEGGWRVGDERSGVSNVVLRVSFERLDPVLVPGSEDSIRFPLL